MVEQAVRLTVSMTVHEGQMEAFKSIAQAMTEGSKAEPGIDNGFGAASIASLINRL